MRKGRPIIDRPIRVPPRGFEPDSERRARARLASVPTTVGDCWEYYSRQLQQSYGVVPPSSIAEAAFYAGAAMMLVMLMRAIETSESPKAAQRRINDLRAEIEAYAESINPEGPPT